MSRIAVSSERTPAGGLCGERRCSGRQGAREGAQSGEADGSRPQGQSSLTFLVTYLTIHLATELAHVHTVTRVSDLSLPALTMAAPKGGMQSFAQLRSCPRPRINAPQWPSRVASRKMGHLATFKVPAVNNEPNVSSQLLTCQLSPLLIIRCSNTMPRAPSTGRSSRKRLRG